MSEMNFEVNLGTGIFSELILGFLIFSSVRDLHNRIGEIRSQQYFILMLTVTFIEIAADALSRMDGSTGIIFDIYTASNMILFLLNPLLMIIWMLYVCDQLSIKNNVRKRALVVFLILTAANAVVSLSTPFSGLIYYFDSANVYHRGPLFMITGTAMLLMAVYTELLLIKYRRNVERNHFISLLVFLMLPVAASILQILVYGYAFALNATVYSELIVFVYVQNRNLDRDYLTGLYNRRKLDNYLNKKMMAADENHQLAAILLDVDNFKSINDKLGHTAGDTALINVAMLLRSITRSDTMVARYGGDEFCIVADVLRRSDLYAIMKRIRNSTESFNSSADRAFHLSFSIGGDIYDPASGMTVSEFQTHIDELMYNDKLAFSASCKNDTDVVKKERREAGTTRENGGE